MEIKERRPTVAALLSLVVPGLGQVYNGQPRKGLVFYFVIFALPVFLPLTHLQCYFYGMLSYLIFGLALHLIIPGHAFIVARKIKETMLRSYNRWYYYLLIVILSFGINTATSDIIKKELLGIKAYKIASGAMMPTMLIGDRITIDLKKYQNEAPQKGDIVVFKYPEDPSRDFVKRIIATEKDIIESKNKTIYINGTAVTEAYVQHNDKENRPSGSDKRDNFGPLTIPKDKVFVMGDNRDQSYDSRHWGYVDKNQIRGKALYFYWSKQTNKIGKEIK